MVGIGRLQSTLPDSELTLRSIRRLKESYNSILRQKADLNDNHYTNFVHDVGQQVRILISLEEEVQAQIVRAIERLRGAESSLKNYHTQFKKAGHPSHVHVAQILQHISRLKDQIKTEQARSARMSGIVRDRV